MTRIIWDKIKEKVSMVSQNIINIHFYGMFCRAMPLKQSQCRVKHSKNTNVMILWDSRMYFYWSHIVWQLQHTLWFKNHLNSILIPAQLPYNHLCLPNTQHSGISNTLKQHSGISNTLKQHTGISNTLKQLIKFYFFIRLHW